MHYTVYRHPDVLQDLLQIVDLIVDYSDLIIAERKITEIEATINSLQETPHIGSVRDDIYPGLRAIPTAKKGVVAFIVDDAKKSVLIVSITYAGGDWVRLAPDRA